MEANPAVISKILSGETQFLVPVFQRNYEWDEPRWESLWTDLSSLLDEEDEQINHFISPFVLVEISYPFDVTRFLVLQPHLETLKYVHYDTRENG